MPKEIIEITQEIINAAIEDRIGEIYTRCIIAQGLKKHFNTNVVRCAIGSARVNGKRIELPKEARNITVLGQSMWITVKPFSFEVEIEEL